VIHWHAERVAELHMIEPRADRPTAITLVGDRFKTQAQELWRGGNTEMHELRQYHCLIGARRVPKTE
jgi:hypothetical protein